MLGPKTAIRANTFCGVRSDVLSFSVGLAFAAGFVCGEIQWLCVPRMKSDKDFLVRAREAHTYCKPVSYKMWELVEASMEVMEAVEVHESTS